MGAACPYCQALDGHAPHCPVSPDPAPSMDDGMLRTHDEPGSPEERYSRQMRFDKYLAMQGVLQRIANAVNEDYLTKEQIREAKDILAGMVRPSTPESRATARAAELEALMFAYRIVNNVGSPGTVNHRAAEITVEALKAWELAHPPQPLDPYLLNRA